MIWYILPTLICLGIKLAVLRFSFRTNNTSKAYVSLVSVIALHNLIEVLGFLQFVFIKDISPIFLFRMYYAALLTMLVYICFYETELTEIKVLSKLTKLIAVIAALIVTVILFSNHIVVGYQEISYSITAIKGTHYWVFQVFVISTLLFILITMIIGYFFSNEQKNQVRCLYGLLSVAPIIFVIVLVMLLMALGFKINAMGILPIATTVFVLITLKTETNYKLTDIRRFLPYSLEHKTSNKIQKVINNYSIDDKNYKQTLTDIESILIKYKHKKMDGNISKTAKALSMPRTTLYSIFLRLGIKPEKKE